MPSLRKMSPREHGKSDVELWRGSSLTTGLNQKLESSRS